MNRLTSPSRIDTDALERETGFGWGWFIVLGAALIVLGSLAFLNLQPAGTVSVYAVGVVMVIGALAQLKTLLVPGWTGSASWSLARSYTARLASSRSSTQDLLRLRRLLCWLSL